jgi:hypothetical protein
MTSHGNGLFYDVRLSKEIKETIKRLHHQAAYESQGHRFLASLRVIYHRLRQDPKNFGEPLYRLPALKLMIYQVVVSPVVVNYGVHEEKPLVFLKGVDLLG